MVTSGRADGSLEDVHEGRPALLERLGDTSPDCAGRGSERIQRQKDQHDAEGDEHDAQHLTAGAFDADGRESCRQEQGRVEEQNPLGSDAVDPRCDAR